MPAPRAVALKTNDSRGNRHHVDTGTGTGFRFRVPTNREVAPDRSQRRAGLGEPGPTVGDLGCQPFVR